MTDDRAQALVEFALVLPVLLLMILGVLDLGRAVYAQSALVSAARTGARVAVVDQNLGTDCGASPGVARCVAAKEAVALGMAAASVDVAFRKADDLGVLCATLTLDCVVEVTVTTTWTAITPVFGIFIKPLTMSSTTRLPLERVYTSP